MAKLCLKKQSKRTPAARRYKIEKRVRAHNRRKAREAKQAERKGQRKMIHVPNLCPFKEDILKSAEEYKVRRDQERAKVWEAARLAKLAEKSQSLEQFAEAAQVKQLGVDDSPPPYADNDVITKKSTDGKQRSFYREFQKVIAAADVILEVVDARDPAGTRCPQVEQLVREAGDNKRLVLVLNKADLVPRKNLDLWLKYLRRFVPAIPFKSSTQAQGKRLGRRKLKKGQEARTGAICMGAEGLTSLLANYTRNKGLKTSIRVGVVGLPNVGKSSLINSLKRSRACKVGAVPGVTRSLQEVQLDSKIKLLDSPGLALASTTDPHAALKNSVLTTDATQAAEMIVARAGPKELSKLYLIAEFKDTTQLLASLAKRFGKYGKGGVPDLPAAAQLLLNDWNKGKISYHTQPPEDVDPHVSSTIVVAPGVAEFDLEKYDAENMLAQETMDTMSDTASTVTDENKFVVSGQPSKKNKRTKKGAKEPLTRKKGETLMEAEAGMRTKKINKIQEKKMRKLKKKNQKNESALAEAITGVTIN